MLSRRAWLGLALVALSCNKEKHMITGPPLTGSLIYTPSNQIISFLDWSSAASKILFSEYILDFTFTTIQPDGTVVDSFPMGSFVNYPYYSPDASKIVYNGNDVTGSPSATFIRAIWTMDADSSNKTEIVSGEYTDFGFVAELSWHNPNWGSNNRIAFHREYITRVNVSLGQFGFESDIWACDPDGGNLTQLTTSPGDGTGTLGDCLPVYSPDGTKIAYMHRDATGDHGWDVWLMDSDGSNQTQLTFNTFNNFAPPAWSADGTRILYTKGTAGGFFPNELWIMDADGSNQKLLILSTALIASPQSIDAYQFSPDGGSIAVVVGGKIFILVPGSSLRGYVASGGNLVGPGNYVV